jgi:hypothetical protein
MADQPAAPPAPPSPPPAFVQSMMIATLRSPLHGLLSKNLVLLRFSGRKSGKRYEIPVAYVQDGDTVLIGTQRPWATNMRGGAPVELQLRGRAVTGAAEVGADPDAVAADLRRLLRGASQVGRFMGVTLDAAGQPDPGQLRDAVARGWVVVKVLVG